MKKVRLTRNLQLLIITITCGACYLTSPALADTIATTELETVVITANRTPQKLQNIAQTVTIIDRADIAASPAESIADLLEYVGGVDVRQRGVRGVQADVSIRGGSFEQVLVLLNGINMSNPQTGHHNMDVAVNINNIERIEIIKGPLARVYGANAMDGVINIITRKQTTPHIGAQVKIGEYDYLAESMQTTFATGDWYHNLSAAQQYSSGFEDDEPTGFNIKNIQYQGDGQIAGQKIETTLAYTDKDFGASRFYFNAPYQHEHTKSFLSSLALNLNNDFFKWRPQISWLHHDDTYTSGYGVNDTATDKYTVNISGDTTTDWGQTTFGIGGEREEIDSSNMGNHHRHSYNLFINHKLPIGDTFTIGAGSSAVYYSDWGWEYLPGAEANYTISNNLQWFASVAKSFRIPTYTEMYYTIGNIGDAHLKAEQALTWESGLRWQQKRLNAHLSIFLKESDDLIDWSRNSDNITWKVRNVAECTTTGIEVGFDLQQPLPVLAMLGRISINYTYLDHDSDSNALEYKYILDSLRHQLQGTIYFDWHQDISHVIKARYEKRMAGDSSIVVDSKLVYSATPAIDISIEASNLFDEDYIESGDTPLPGRWVMVGVSLQHDFL